MQVMCLIHVCCIEHVCVHLKIQWCDLISDLDLRSWLLRNILICINLISPLIFSQRCVPRSTCSLRVWFSAWAVASSFSVSWSFRCAFSQVFFRLFRSSLLSTLLWQFSRRDFCNRKQTSKISVTWKHQYTQKKRCKSCYVSRWFFRQKHGGRPKYLHHFDQTSFY